MNESWRDAINQYSAENLVDEIPAVCDYCGRDLRYSDEVITRRDFVPLTFEVMKMVLMLVHKDCNIKMEN